LSEELLATARSFVKLYRVVSTHSADAHLLREIRKLEKASVKYYESVKDYERGKLRQLFPDFWTLYYETIKKVITWAEFDDLLIRALYR
jgi:hypothetical protein